MQRLAIEPYQWFLFSVSFLLQFILRDSNQFIFYVLAQTPHHSNSQPKCAQQHFMYQSLCNTCNPAFHLSLSLSEPMQHMQPSPVRVISGPMQHMQPSPVPRCPFTVDLSEILVKARTLQTSSHHLTVQPQLPFANTQSNAQPTLPMALSHLVVLIVLHSDVFTFCSLMQSLQKPVDTRCPPTRQ